MPPKEGRDEPRKGKEMPKERVSRLIRETNRGRGKTESRDYNPTPPSEN